MRATTSETASVWVEPSARLGVVWVVAGARSAVGSGGAEPGRAGGLELRLGASKSAPGLMGLS